MCRVRSYLAVVACFVVCLGGEINAYAGSRVDGDGPPFYASIRSDNVNVRTGPSARYPVRWVYQRKNWPIRVVTAFEDWYQIEDMYGQAGWVYEGMVSRRRHVVAQGDEPQAVFRSPDESSRKAFLMEPGVIASLETCHAGWCQISVDGYDGWAPKRSLWGGD